MNPEAATTAFLRRLRRRLAAPLEPSLPVAGVFVEHTRRFTLAQGLVHAFYAFVLYLAVAQLTEIPVYAARSAFHPLWPVGWLSSSGDGTNAIRAVFAFFLGTSLLAAALPGWRTARVLCSLGLLEYVALKNSYGKIGHSMHLPVLLSMVFVLLPHGWERSAPRTGRALRQGTLLVFWTAGTVVLLSYTMSGVGKLGGALYQLARGQPNAFAPGALGAHIAQRLLQTDSQSLLGAWIIEHPWLTWPAMPFAVYLELFSVLVAFRPAWSRPWAALLVIFHIGNYFTLTIAFPPSCFLLALFFFRSPFDPGGVGGRRAVFSVPLLGDVLYFVQSARRRAHEKVKTK